MPATATTKERVLERSQRLYEDGYRAAEINPGTGIYLMITPGGDSYTIDQCVPSCDCNFYPFNGFCKHSSGLAKLIKDQQRARSTRLELRKQVGSAPAVAQGQQPAPEFPLVRASQAQPPRRPSAAQMADDFGASPAEIRAINAQAEAEYQRRKAGR